LESHYMDEWRELVKSNVGEDDLVVTCGGLMEKRGEKECEDAGFWVKKLNMAAIRSGDVERKSKSAEMLLKEIEGSKEKLEELRSNKKDLEESIEYQDVMSGSSRSKKLLKENYGKLRGELLERIESYRLLIEKEVSEYGGLGKGFDHVVTDKA